MFRESQEILNILLLLLITLIAATDTESGKFLFIEQRELMMPMLLTVVLYSMFAIIGTILQIYNGRFIPIIICVMLVMGGTDVFVLLRTILTIFAWIALAMWVGMFTSVDYDYVVQRIKNCIKGASDGARDQVPVVNLFKELQEILNKSLTLLIALITIINTDSGKNLFIEQNELVMPLLLTIVLYSFFAIIGTTLHVYNNGRFLPIVIFAMPIMGGVAAFLLLRTISSTFAWISLAMWVGTFTLVAYDYVVHQRIKNCIEGPSHGARDQVPVVNVFKELREILIKYLTLLNTLITAISTDLGKLLLIEEHEVMMPLFLTIVIYSFFAMIGTILEGRFLPLIICTMLIMGGVAAFLLLRIISPTSAWITLAVWVGTFTLVAYDSGIPQRIKNWIKGRITRT